MILSLLPPRHGRKRFVQIMASYKEESAALYLPGDLARGSISSVDRKGCPYQFPLVSLSIGVVNNELRRPHSVQEVGYLAAEAKRHAKQSTDNIFYISSHRDRPCADQERRTSLPVSASSKTTPTSAGRPSSSSMLPYAYSRPYEDLLCFTDDKAVKEYESHAH